MRPLLVLALLASACGLRPDPAAQAGPDPLTGTIEAVDLSPMAYDGDAEISLRTDGGEIVEVRVPARMNLCEATGLDLLNVLDVGMTLEVVGERENGVVRPCQSAEHRLSLPGFALDAFEGVYVSGFETSNFTPCGETDVYWWLTPNDDLLAQYNGLQDEPRGRGLGPFVRVRVEGLLSPEGEYGHLGASPRELKVTRVLSLEYLADGDGDWPTVECSE